MVNLVNAGENFAKMKRQKREWEISKYIIPTLNKINNEKINLELYMSGCGVFDNRVRVEYAFKQILMEKFGRELGLINSEKNNIINNYNNFWNNIKSIANKEFKVDLNKILGLGNGVRM